MLKQTSDPFTTVYLFILEKRREQKQKETPKTDDFGEQAVSGAGDTDSREPVREAFYHATN